MRNSNSPVNAARSSVPKHPRFIETGADMPHSVSFSDNLCDTPNSAIHPFEQDEFNVSPQNSARGVALFSYQTDVFTANFYPFSPLLSHTDRPFPSHTSLDTLEEGRDRAGSTSTTLTAVANDAADTDSRAGVEGRQSHNSQHSQQSQHSQSQENHSQGDSSHIIEAERADSDMPMHAESLVTAAHLRRRATYAEFEHPLEDFDDEGDE